MAAVGSGRPYTLGLVSILKNCPIGFPIPIKVDVTFRFQKISTEFSFSN